MKFIPTLFLSGVLLASVVCVSARAQTATELATGEVRKVDKAASKITIKHGEIKSLDMPPMTMVFSVKEPAMLDKVKAGDKVKFGVAMQDSKMVVTELQRLP